MYFTQTIEGYLIRISGLINPLHLSTYPYTGFTTCSSDILITHPFPEPFWATHLNPTLIAPITTTLAITISSARPLGPVIADWTLEILAWILNGETTKATEKDWRPRGERKEGGGSFNRQPPKYPWLISRSQVSGIGNRLPKAFTYTQLAPYKDQLASRYYKLNQAHILDHNFRPSHTNLSPGQ